MRETEDGIDKEDVLREIAAALPMDDPIEEAPLDDLPPPEPLAPPPPPAEPEALPPRPLSSRMLPRPSWWSRHRDEVAGLVTAFMALVWISLGIAARAWAPSLVGVSLSLGALLIGTQAVWTRD